MRKELMEMVEWEDAGKEEDCSFLRYEDTFILSTPNTHIYTDDLDQLAERHGLKVDDVIFMSRHSAASGEAAMTVHPIGNYHENKYGGIEKKLVRSSPALMTDALRRISSYNDMPDFHICYEVTHHGPWLDKPTFFIEIGSDERNWGNVQAAKILAKVLLDNESKDYVSAIGVAGGHYAPRFTEVALAYQINFGHMIPNYQIEGRDDEDIVRMVSDACTATDTKIVYMHRKAMKKPEENRIHELISSVGFEIVSSKDLNEI